MVPDDEAGVTVVDLLETAGLPVLLQVSSSPLYVSSASHQCSHCSLDHLCLGLVALLILFTSG